MITETVKSEEDKQELAEWKERQVKAASKTE